jgi:hypothetical protein
MFCMHNTLNLQSEIYSWSTLGIKTTNLALIAIYETIVSGRWGVGT